MARIILRIKDAIDLLEIIGNHSAFIEELKGEDPNDWLVEGDLANEDGTPKMYILKDTEENRYILMQHQAVDLNLNNSA